MTMASTCTSRATSITTSACKWLRSLAACPRYHCRMHAQSLLSAVVMGIAIGITTITAGAMYGVIGAQSYYPMAGLAVASAILGLLLYIRLSRDT